MPMSPGETMAGQAPPMGMGQPAPEQLGNEMNPVLEAFRVIMQFVATKGSRGDPRASEMQAILAQLVQMITESAGGQGIEGSMMAPPAPDQQPGGARVPTTGGANPMIGNSPGAKAMTGGIPVI